MKDSNNNLNSTTFSQYLFSLREQSFDILLNAISETFSQNPNHLIQFQKNCKEIKKILKHYIESEREVFLSYLLASLDKNNLLPMQIQGIIKSPLSSKIESNKKIRDALIQISKNNSNLSQYPTSTLIHNFYFEISFIKSIFKQCKSLILAFFVKLPPG